MKIHIFKNVPFEDGANIEKWAKLNGIEVQEYDLFSEYELPKPKDVQFAAIMGGPMNVYEDRKYPWLKDIKKFIQNCIRTEKKVLGVCLGAQLIASVLGAKVDKNRYKEIGWWNVKKCQSTEGTYFENLPDNFTSFHWHGDTFEIPRNSRRLAFSQACSNQAFQYKENVLGLQFHLEYSKQSIDRLIENCGDEMEPNREFVQNHEQILSQMTYTKETEELLFKLLDRFFLEK